MIKEARGVDEKALMADDTAALKKVVGALDDEWIRKWVSFGIMVGQTPDLSDGWSTSKRWKRALRLSAPFVVKGEDSLGESRFSEAEEWVLTWAISAHKESGILANVIGHLQENLQASEGHNWMVGRSAARATTEQ